jgi:hypothetical protein
MDGVCLPLILSRENVHDIIIWVPPRIVLIIYNLVNIQTIGPQCCLSRTSTCMQDREYRTSSIGQFHGDIVHWYALLIFRYGGKDSAWTGQIEIYTQHNRTPNSPRIRKSIAPDYVLDLNWWFGEFDKGLGRVFRYKTRFEVVQWIKEVMYA